MGSQGGVEEMTRREGITKTKVISLTGPGVASQEEMSSGDGWTEVLPFERQSVSFPKHN